MSAQSIPSAIQWFAGGLLALPASRTVIAQPRLVAVREDNLAVKLSWDDPTAGFFSNRVPLWVLEL